jgi:voltage-gated potassium channel Kch
MTTVGYGDISPHRLSKLEMAVAMFSMLIGTTVFAYVIGELVIAVLNFDPAEKEFKAKKRSLKKFLEDRALPAALSDRARKGLEYFADYSSVFEERALFDEMPEFLLRKVIAYK